jgi:two-component system C4-dicarboxylate transport sensor histidine kinase DctB
VKVVEDAVELTQARLRECSVRLNWVSQPRGKVFVRGGEVRLTQVLVNLINNAVDAMLDQDNREIRIEIGPAEGNKAGRLAVTVSDIGPGLKEPEKVFDPFYSTKAVGSAGGEEGMGLGLSISYGLVQSFGGNIRGRNGAHGAEFAVELEGWKAEEDRK